MRDRAAWAVALLPVLVLTLPGVVTGRAPLEGDLLVYQLPIYEVLSDAAAAGRFPWWDPTVQSGTPFFANPQTQLLWPVTWLHALLPHGPALMLWLLAHGLLMAVGSMFWLRARGVEAAHAAVGTIVFTLGGPVLSLVTKPDKLPAFALVPWLLWGLVLWSAGRRRAGAALVVGAQVGMALSGGLEIWILALAGALLFVIADGEGRGRARDAGLLVFSCVVAFAIAGVQLVPFVELMNHSTRSAGIDYAAVVKWSLEPAHLLDGFFHLAFLHTDHPVRFLAHAGGGSVAAAALLAWTLRTRDDAHRGPRGETAIIAVGVVGFVLLAMGDATPVHRVAYELVPPLKSLRYPEKYLWGAWPFVVLAVARGIGRAKLVPRSTWGLVLLVVVVAGVVGGVDWKAISAAVLTGSCVVLWRSGVNMAALAALELSIVALLLIPPVDVETVVARGDAVAEPVPRYFNVDRHLDKRTPLPPKTNPQQRLVDVSERAWPNVGVLRDQNGKRRFEYADGVRAVRLERQDLYFDHVAPQPMGSALLLLRRAGVGALGFLSAERHDAWTEAAGVDSTFRAPHTVVSVPGFRRLGWARTAWVVGDDGAAFRALGEADLLEDRAIVLEVDSPGVQDATARAVSAPDVEPPNPTWTRPRPNIFEIDVPAVGGWLVVREAWAPGWAATVEQQGEVLDLPVARADFYLQAVPIPSVETGETVRIRLSYRPSGLGVGLLVSVLGLVSFLAALGALGAVDGRPHRLPRPST